MNTDNRTHSEAPPNFNRLARIYRWMELATFGPLLQRSRCAFLPALGSARRALVLGDGDGRFTAQLLRTNRQVQIDAVDASSAMLDELLRRAGSAANRVRVFRADARNWQPANPPYDLVVTHFFLDCLTLEELQRLAETVRTAVESGAQWLVSDFAIPQGWFGRLVARPLVACLYVAFGWLTGLKVRALSDHGPALRRSGFTMMRQQSRLGGLLISELWSI